MNALTWRLPAALFLALALSLPGCGAKVVGPGHGGQGSSTGPATTGTGQGTESGSGGGDSVDDDHIVDTDFKPLEGKISDTEKQRIVHEALMNLQRMAIVSDETMALSDGLESSTVANDVLTTKLAELSFNVIAMNKYLPFSPTEEEQDQFRQSNDVNLAFLLHGQAQQADKFGNFYKHRCELKGKVLNLTTHQLIASRTIRRESERSTEESLAAQDALEKAARDLAVYLTDEVRRKWEATSLVRVHLQIADLKHIAAVDDVRIGLQRRVGIYYVSLEGWDERSDTATYEVLCRFDVQRFLPAYIDELRNGRVRVVQYGKAIKADRDCVD